jgi:hypothetical protein
MWHRRTHFFIVAAVICVVGIGCAGSSRDVSATTILVPANETAPPVAAANDKVQLMTLPTVETSDCFPQMPVWVRRESGVIQVEDVARYDNRRLDKAYHRVAFIDDGRVGYCTPLGEVVIPPRFDAGQAFQEGIAVVQLGGKYGYVDQFGEWVVKPELEFAYGFWHGVGAAKRDGKYGIVNHAGEWIKEPSFAYVAAVGGGVQAKTDTGEEGFIDSRGNFIKTGKLASFYRPPKVK